MLQIVANAHRVAYFASKGNEMLHSVAFEENDRNIQIITKGKLWDGKKTGKGFQFFR